MFTHLYAQQHGFCFCLCRQRVESDVRVGAMPLIEDDWFVGIVNRGEILRTVILHCNLDVWK